VAAEKVRRRSVERKQRQAHQQQVQLQQQPAAARPHNLDNNLRQPGRRQQQQQQQPRVDLLLGRQRSASEGRLDVLLGPHTPEGSREAATAALRLAAVSPDWLAASERASDSRSASAVALICSSAPPQQDMAWREELLQHVASRPAWRPRCGDPLLLTDSHQQPAAPAVAAAPTAAAASGAAEGTAFPANPGLGNFTASAVRARAQPVFLPLNTADDKSTAPHAAWLPVAGTAGKKKGPLAALSRLLHW
jgi:hypothetical protein